MDSAKVSHLRSGLKGKKKKVGRILLMKSCHRGITLKSGEIGRLHYGTVQSTWDSFKKSEFKHQLHQLQLGQGILMSFNSIFLNY